MELLLEIAKLGIDNPQEAHHLSEMLKTQTILREKKDGFLNVSDCEGNPLVEGGLYLLERRGMTSKTKIIREVFGCGNFTDTYYQVYYLDETLEEKMICVEGKFSFSNPTNYKSNFKPIR